MPSKINEDERDLRVRVLWHIPVGLYPWLLKQYCVSCGRVIPIKWWGGRAPEHEKSKTLLSIIWDERM